MLVRLAEEKDLPQAVKIVEQAKKFLAEQNIDQWQSGYPNAEVLREDIAKKQLYVCQKDDSNPQSPLMAIAVLSYEKEDSYEQIEGKWNGQETTDTVEYAVIHRVAVSPDFQGRGCAKAIFAHLQTQARAYLGENGYIRVDTHPENKIMQAVILKNGYSYTGIIHVEEGNEGKKIRYAYDKPLK